MCTTGREIPSSDRVADGIHVDILDGGRPGKRMNSFALKTRKGIPTGQWKIKNANDFVIGAFKKMEGQLRLRAIIIQWSKVKSAETIAAT